MFSSHPKKRRDQEAHLRYLQQQGRQHTKIDGASNGKKEKVKNSKR